MELEGTIRRDNFYDAKSIIEHWPSYGRVLMFIKTEATLKEIKLFLDFLRKFYRSNIIRKEIKFPYNLRSPLRKASKMKNSLIAEIFLKSLYPDDKCICTQVQSFSEISEYNLWKRLKTKKVQHYHFHAYCVIPNKRVK